MSADQLVSNVTPDVPGVHGVVILANEPVQLCDPPSPVEEGKQLLGGSQPCRVHAANLPTRLLLTPEQGNRLGDKAFATAGEAEAVGRRRPHAHSSGLDPERAAQALTHLRAYRADPGLLTDEHAIGVDELVAGVPDLAVRLPEEIERGRSSVLLVTRGKEGADVAEARRPEERVDERMCDDVAVGVPGETARVVDRHAAEDEWHALDEGVRVDPEPDTQLRHRSQANAWLRYQLCRGFELRCLRTLDHRGGVDKVDGGTEIDTCLAETKANCEK